MEDVFVVSAVRTAIGTFGGALKNFTPADLGARTAQEAMTRAGVAPSDIGHVVYGQVAQTGPEDAYLSRVISVNAKVPVEVPALTVNRLCGSGIQALISAAQGMMLDEYDMALVGGAECMSRVPFHAPAMRWGSKLGDAVLVDALVGILNDPFHRYHMGVTAENIAERYQITRADQDGLAQTSHARASHAIKDGRFKDQILAIESKVRGKTVVFDTDEHVRHDFSLEEAAGLRPVFKKEGGTVTPANASGINDGAASLVIATGKAVASKGLKPLARVVGWAHAGVDPAYMGIGPVPATRKLLEKSGLKLSDIDIIEANEAFAAQACAVTKELGLDPEKVNPNGSGISLGHPVGATGAIISTKAIYELHRTGGRYALATMCIGGGQGIAIIYERV